MSVFNWRMLKTYSEARRAGRFRRHKVRQNGLYSAVVVTLPLATQIPLSLAAIASGELLC
jgi:hypothetical protein